MNNGLRYLIKINLDPKEILSIGPCITFEKKMYLDSIGVWGYSSKAQINNHKTPYTEKWKPVD